MDPNEDRSQTTPSTQKTSDKLKKIATDFRLIERVVPTAFLISVLLPLVYFVLFAPPAGLQTPAVIKISPDETVDQIALQLKDEHIVRSAELFKIIARMLGGNRHLQAGSYFFPEPQSMLIVALRLIEGDLELKPVRITIAEGSTARDIGDLIAHKLMPFDENQFLSLAIPAEGRLYPDTYFFYPGQEPSVVVQSMENNFNKHISNATTTTFIIRSKHSLNDIITMASILVGEAKTDKDRRMVAGILWHRIQIGMPLQVDAPFGYILDKNLTDLTHSDLAVNSPYNTYQNKGLPPTPIGNVDLGAINAAADPIASNYLYYLSDRSGVMHYSSTYAQHLRNIATYLR